MKRSWQVRRSVNPRDDGQQHWDYVYQFLLQWAMARTTGERTGPSQPPEDNHGSSLVCACLDRAATASSVH